MILNGEFDFLTPRALHETLRLQIPDSALVIIPHAFHAFTLEKPALTADLLSGLPRMFSPENGRATARYG